MKVRFFKNKDGLWKAKVFVNINILIKEYRPQQKYRYRNLNQYDWITIDQDFLGFDISGITKFAIWLDTKRWIKEHEKLNNIDENYIESFNNWFITEKNWNKKLLKEQNFLTKLKILKKLYKNRVREF